MGILKQFFKQMFKKIKKIMQKLWVSPARPSFGTARLTSLLSTYKIYVYIVSSKEMGGSGTKWPLDPDVIWQHFPVNND